MIRLFAKIAASLIFLLVSLVTPQSSADDKKYVYDYGSLVSFSSTPTKLGQVCVRFSAMMSAGGFFKGLEYVKTDSDGEFRKDGRRVALFPEELDIRVGFGTWGDPLANASTQCTRKTPSQQASAAELTDLLRSLRIEASWKRGVELRAAELITLPELTTKPRPFESTMVVWNYTFHVRAGDVPLTDHFVVSAYSTDKLLGRVSLDLASDITIPPGLRR
jgi:hypothetical protein